ncbi:unnamed protein product [Cercopithifilaria johnstoni]|uniref:Uncharacterized protein n=1 Tax=Cercopithifilaria johnstoni TaxID=2874296 RepID=A0A8J2MAM4_9BILA|nr:unnamed protein product [Cercopithifilaria johnstoni]
MEQNPIFTNDMSYFDVSKGTATSKKGSAELESLKQSVKAVTSGTTSARENATKQTLPSRKSSSSQQLNQ